MMLNSHYLSAMLFGLCRFRKSGTNTRPSLSPQSDARKPKRSSHAFHSAADNRPFRAHPGSRQHCAPFCPVAARKEGGVAR